ncbi:MAG TPA: UDP-glucose/GDP-mannose dehydrogenase family protein [Bacteroidales bacterium]|nr:UDP-glucose/GDP-mannose dehydrogenase family protein [Bacteroidales bacterium]
MKISMIGTGYVGLVSGTCFAETGVSVTCVDIDESKIQKLNKGIIPIYEPGLEPMVIKNKEKGQLFFTTSIAESIKEAEVAFIAVGTPPDEDGSADLQYVLAVASEIGKHLDHYMVIVNKSTVPVGTAQKVKATIQNELQKRNVNYAFDVVSNPEFLKEGNAIEDFLRPDRIVIGVESQEAEKVMRKLYKPFILNNHPIVFMDIASAELTKYAANAMLATRISFMNEIARVCELVGADVNMVRKGIGSDPRIGSKFLYAGAGYGGSCFPKDVKALIRTTREYNYEFQVLKSVDEVNEEQKVILAKKVLAHFNQNVKDKKFAMWGLSFKPNTDDMREAPSLAIIKELKQHGAGIIAYDPVAMDESKRRIGNTIEYAQNPYDALKNVNGLILVTEWNEFRIPDLNKMKELMSEPVIFDGRNIYEPSEIREAGFIYYGLGRK